METEASRKLVLDYLAAHCLPPAPRIVDIGAGTGISSRWLASRGWSVLAIEPNDDMRSQAQAASDPSIRFQSGTGEHTGLAAASADAVVCCQAFHWLEPDAALAEFERILAPGGWTCLIWNERDNADPFTADFGAIIRASPESARTEDARQRAAHAFLTSDRSLDKQKLDFPHAQTLDEAGLLGRAFSMSHTPRSAEGKAKLGAELSACFQRWRREDRVTLRYTTSLYLGRKRP